MERSGHLCSTVFILVLLLVAIGTGPMVAEGKKEQMSSKDKNSSTCECPSHKYHGLCFRFIFSSNCAATCKEEGFMGGKCKGFHMRCICTKQC
ncbi:defensin-like protein 2 [Pyrus ussuriensis x Pyrus communis]|uniref:Defensin-like protein 2 n=1 Tax=Pyrus ussuriensis x Pyrus communis TaxID=2448454 RepID=A0A5N5G3Z0_9ROSA|nr:defensin-like protein 2 [Pyrus ussuriensis x Pyrus communis]